MLALDRVGKTYPNGVHALERFSADIRLGEIVAIIGGSGCGKSTLLRAIAGLDRASTGTVTLDEIAITAPRGNKQVLFQIWDAENAKLLVTVPRTKGQDAIISLKWSPDGEMVATAEGTDENIKLWNLKGDLLQTLTLSCMPMNFSPDGRYLVTGGKLSDRKTDTGYVWEFGAAPKDEKLALLR